MCYCGYTGVERIPKWESAQQVDPGEETRDSLTVSIMIPSGGALPLSHPLSPSCSSSMSVSGLLIRCQIYAAVICISVSWTWACRLGLGQSSLKFHRCRVSRFGLYSDKALVGLVSRRASARFCFGSPFSSKRLCFDIVGILFVHNFSLASVNETLTWLSSLRILMQESFSVVVTV